ncbi:EamA family transporter [Bacillus sp. (in: firmicutes)]|uniref:DMT family transporter n=1 Tax=Bacillus sp. TaxID=1409 RepID=UPI0023F49303|nr:EamA family transporter [Bacillus sp. (in: firmicutes)]
MNASNRRMGLFYVITGATCWGIGGTVAKKLFQDDQVDVNWFVTIRLLTAGILLLMLQLFRKDRSQIIEIWKNKASAGQLLVFGLFGMLAVQYTYMASIEHGNAAVATLLQYLSPVIIILYSLLRKQSALTKQGIVTVLLALAGCFFLLTNGSISQLSVPEIAVVWGLLSGFAAAFYTLYAVGLLKKFDSLVVVGWAMIIGGFALSFIHPPWQIDFKSLTAEAYVHLLFVTVFGTTIAFWFFIKSLQSLSPKETSLLGSLEPLSAVVTTVVWLKEPFGFFQWVGAFCIIGITLILALHKEPSMQSEKTILNNANKNM